MRSFGDDSINFSDIDSQPNSLPKVSDKQFPSEEPKNKTEKEEPANSNQSEEQKRGKKSKHKSKNIKKPKDNGKTENPKRVPDPDIKLKVRMGRPDNKGLEQQHLKISKSYSDIFLHYSRFIVFLRMKRGEERKLHSMDLTIEQNRIINQSEEIMSKDNFPDFHAEKPSFLLHPNSPHYVMSYLKQNENKINYTSEEMQYIMIAYLRRRKILTTTVYHYLCDYWKDIIFLVNNPKGESFPGNIPEDYQIDIGQPVEMPNSQENNESIDNNRINNNEKKEKTTPSEDELLKKQFDQDHSLAAFEIACYLEACTKKYGITISPP